MRQQDFEYLQQLLKGRSGIVLSPDKTYLVESRLMPVVRARGLAGLDDLIQAVRVRGETRLIDEVVDAMTTNESYFFRDIQPFEAFRRAVLPGLVKARRDIGRNRVRIWSAGCSSGQEPYTVAMILKEEAALVAGFQVEILATDLSSQVIERARSGLYSQFEVQRGLPIHYLVKYFAQRGEHWQIDRSIRDTVVIRQFNLLDDYRMLGTFDVVFCRNVLLYFDQPTKTDVLDRMAGTLAPDGVLYLGGAESVLGLTEAFRPLPGMRGVYALSEAMQAKSALLRAGLAG